MCVVKYERLVLRRKLALRHFRLMGKCSALVRELHDVVEVLRINLLFKWNSFGTSRDVNQLWGHWGHRSSHLGWPGVLCRWLSSLLLSCWG